MFVFGAKNFSRGKGPKGPFPLELPLIKNNSWTRGRRLHPPPKTPTSTSVLQREEWSNRPEIVLGSITIWGGCLAYCRTTAWTHGRVVSLS